MIFVFVKICNISYFTNISDIFSSWNKTIKIQDVLFSSMAHVLVWAQKQQFFAHTAMTMRNRGILQF